MDTGSPLVYRPLACRPVVYQIDAADRITHVNDAFTAFDESDGGAALPPSRVLGRSLWEFLADTTTRYVYRSMVQRVRGQRTPIRFRFRCDSPSRRRLLAMEITGDGSGEVRFAVSPVLEEERAPVAPLFGADGRTDGLLEICGWCKRVPLPSGQWVELEEAIQALGLFSGGTEPRLTHGMCPTCYTAVLGMLDGREPRAAGTVTLGDLPRH